MPARRWPISALLLERGPAVCLFARSDNVPALRLYDAVGMRRTITPTAR